MFLKLWYQLSCPRCEACNWVSAGDNDDTYLEPHLEAFHCWKCKTSYYLDSEQQCFEDDRAIVEPGLKKPTKDL